MTRFAVLVLLVLMGIGVRHRSEAGSLDYYQVLVQPQAGKALKIRVQAFGSLKPVGAVRVVTKDVGWVGPCRATTGDTVRYQVPVLPEKRGQNNLGRVDFYERCGGKKLGEAKINAYFADAQSTSAGSLFDGLFGLRTSFGKGTLPRGTKVVFSSTLVELGGCIVAAIGAFAEPGVLPNLPITVRMTIGGFDNDGVIWRISPSGTRVQLPTEHELFTILKAQTRRWGTFAVLDPDGCP